MAETQQLPSWMTVATMVYTNAAGQPTATMTTTLELPLTYYGPSIPLGTDGAWTYGGLTSPALSTTSMSSSATPTSFTATHTSSSSSSASTSTSTTITTTTATASTTPYPYSTSSILSKGALIGIIFGAIIFFIVMLLLFICFIRHRARRRNSGYHQTPIWTHWEVVGPSGQQPDEERPAGVGSPRGSGEEADSFLQRSASATNGARRGSSSVRPVSSLPPGAAPPQIIGSTNSGDSGHTSSSAVTDYGVLLPDGGRIGQAYRDETMFPARPSSEMTGHIIPPGELLRIDDEEEPQSPPRMYGVPRVSDPSLPEVFSPLLPPPPLDLDRLSSRKPSSLLEKEKSVRSLSYPASDMEDSKVYTARRVRVQELGPRSPADDETSSNTHAESGPVAGPSSWRNSFGLGSIGRLRKSWFGVSSSRNTSRSSHGRGRSEDAEGQSLLAAPRARSRGGLGLTIDGERPISSVSTKSAVSGNTVYHDAVSRLGTPVSIPSRAMTPASGGGAAPGGDFVPPLPTGAPPAYALSDPYSSLGSRGSFPYSQGVDVLDLPVPEPASPFAASGGMSSTARSAAPPGLSGSHSRAWRDSLSVITGSSNEASITIDVLDAEPPRAGEGWRSMAGGLGGGGGGPDPSERRTTFGTPQLVHQRHPMLSEQGSLHSMRSHLSPYSRSSGSAPTSSRHSHGLSGSNSSRPSAHSRVQTASSGSLRSGSLSSFGRRTGGTGFPISPALSAFGASVNDSGRVSAQEMEELPSPTSEGASRMSFLGPMPSFTARSTMSAPTIRSVGATTTSDDTEVTRTTVTATEASDGALIDRESSDDLASRFRLGNFDFERVRV
ncbi:hypothetical protein HYDPIDRAFT_114155 [Hydnomerulius pinastri MD-312]|uniref:Uncharacterized protein n=1 Tax=Hydnomerulius pinastri MD-312 TaxID=994086 RepID=A0A0C9VBE9_9AGAM|nr:hypothetical protein HYDPIDRAFT_114155 [Hydnomerulius pinastri MD-312]